MSTVETSLPAHSLTTSGSSTAIQADSLTVFSGGLIDNRNNQYWAFLFMRVPQSSNSPLALRFYGMEIEYEVDRVAN